MKMILHYFFKSFLYRKPGLGTGSWLKAVRKYGKDLTSTQIAYMASIWHKNLVCWNTMTWLNALSLTVWWRDHWWSLARTVMASGHFQNNSSHWFMWWYMGCCRAGNLISGCFEYFLRKPFKLLNFTASVISAKSLVISCLKSWEGVLLRDQTRRWLSCTTSIAK